MSNLFTEEKYIAEYCHYTDKLTVSFRGRIESVFVGLVLKNMDKILTKEEEISNALNFLLIK